MTVQTEVEAAIRQFDTTTATLKDVVYMLTLKGFSFTDKAEREYPAIAQHWSLAGVQASCAWQQHRMVEDAIYAWHFEYGEYPSEFNLIDRLAGDRRVSHEQAKAWVAAAVKASPTDSYVAYVPADAPADEKMPTLRAKLSPSGLSLVEDVPSAVEIG